MNLQRLRYFVAVADELHFGRAAERLHMAQPPLSQQIRVLETELGVVLLDRTTRRVELTAAGALLLPEARRLVAQADAVERLMVDHASGEAGSVRLGFVDSSSYAVMPSFVRAHREAHPAVQFELHTLSSDAQWAALRAGELDLGIARCAPAADDLDVVVIRDERLYVAVPTGHPVAGRQSTSLGRLAGESFIGFDRQESPALAREMRSLLAEAGVEWDPILEAEEYTTILGLVAAGEGIAVVPASVRSFQPANLRYVRLRDRQATTRLLVLTRRNDPLGVVQRARAVAATVFP